MDNQNETENNAGSTEETTGITAPVIDDKELLNVLKQRAAVMGITFSNNIGLEALRAKINAKMDGQADPSEAVVQKNPLSDEDPEAPKKTLRQEIFEENMKLVRLRIQNLDPKKKDLPGEIFTVANEYLGTVRKFIPFGEVTEDGYHVPWCLYQMMKERKYLNIRTTKDRRTGQLRVEHNWVPEFALEVLPQLTLDELAKLANAQKAAGSID